MVLYRSTVLLVTCASCLGFLPSPARGLIYPNRTGEDRIASIADSVAINSRQFAQASSPESFTRPPLEPGTQGQAVRELQKTLKALGYYTGTEDGVYGATTADAVSKFQESAGLEADGVVGFTTWDRLQTAQKQANPTPAAAQQPSNSNAKSSSGLQGKLKWLLLGFGVLAVGGVVGGLFYLLMRSGENPEDSDPQSRHQGSAQKPKPAESESTYRTHETDANSGIGQHTYDSNGYPNSIPGNSEKKDEKEPTDSSPSEVLALEEITRLPKIDIIDELIKDLHKPDPAKRRKAIWELGQRGDSRAVQPLVNLMVDSDSKQRSLILAALSEIGTRTLKPMNRALAVSLQDDNAEVRKNAIRDLTRIYDLVSQMSQLLRHAIDDPDSEVQETARWALTQLSNIRGLPGAENRPTFSNSANPQEDSAGDSSR